MKMKNLEKVINATTGTQMLIDKVLYPLLDAIYMFKVTDSYNELPNPKLPFGDIQGYMNRCFYMIYGALDKNIYIDTDTYFKVKTIIKDVQGFVNKYSGVDGLDTKYFRFNPNLRFFTAAYDVRKRSEDEYYAYEELGTLRIKISSKDLQEGMEYFARKQKESDTGNFHYDKDDFLMHELAYAVRLAFIEALSR